MAIFKLDPPPATDDAAVLRSWMNDLYDEIKNTVYALDEDNFSDEFIERLGGSK